MLFNHLKYVGIAGLLILLISGVQAGAAENSTDGPRWDHDPFRYISTSTRNSSRSAKQVNTIKGKTNTEGLNGIFVSNGVYQALYNGKLVRTGERVGDVLIRKIALYSIVIEDGAGRRRIDLFHEK
jgi:hypothetical protein